ncbi:recombinase RecT, partial [Lactococcus fujiensis]
EVTNINHFMKSAPVQARFQEVLGKKSSGFVSSLLTVVNNNNLLKRATPDSIMTAAMKAATLDLPIEPSLGFAYIIPYGQEAQFQIGYKGLIQLALRSGQITGLNSGIVYKSQFISYDPLFEELEIDFMQPEDEVVGYFASMKLSNGFMKVVYWTKARVENHKKRFSKAGAKSPWATDFDAMAQKTVLKAMISKFAPLSQEMQIAVIADNESETLEPKDVTPEQPLISIDEPKENENSQSQISIPEDQAPQQENEEFVEELFPVGQA